MSADFAPDLHYAGSGVEYFRFWCQKTLPLVYDDSLSYYELLCKVAKYVVDSVDDISELGSAYIRLQDYVNHYFDNLGVQEEINNKLDEMAEDGTLSEIIEGILGAGKNIVLITASYGDPNVVGYTNTFLTKTQYRIQHNSNMKVFYGYKSAASFSGRITSGGTPITYDGALDMAVDNIQSAGSTTNSIGHVYIVGGGNDSGATRSAIASGMMAFMARLKSTFPNARVSFIWASWRLRATADKYTEMNNTITLMKELCAKNGIGYCSNSEFIFHQYNTSWYKDGDSLHPSETGADYFADGVVQCILTGSCDCIKEEKFIVDVAQGETPHPFLTRPESTEDNFQYQFQHLTDFVVRQVNETTYIIPGRSQYNPSCQLNSGFMGSFGRNPRYMVPFVFAYVNSGLVKCVGDSAQYGGFPINIFVVDADNTICNTVNALGKFIAHWDDELSTYKSALWLNGVRDSTYFNVGLNGEARIYIPVVTLPTAYC